MSSSDSNAAPQRQAVPRRRPPSGPSNSARDLESIRRRRRQVEEKLLESGVPQLFKDLERRVASVEARLEAVAGVSGAPRLQGPAADTTQTTAYRAAARADESGDILNGRIAEGVLADILQMLSSNLSTGLFMINGASGEELRLYFDEGQIVHGAGMGLSGEGALFAGMAIEAGRFTFRENAEPAPEKTIGSKTQFLILEALRQIDEARANGAKHE